MANYQIEDVSGRDIYLSGPDYSPDLFGGAGKLAYLGIGDDGLMHWRLSVPPEHDFEEVTELVMLSLVAPRTSDLRERAAALQHAIWSKWARQLFATGRGLEDGSMLFTADQVAQQLQAATTDYDGLYLDGHPQHFNDAALRAIEAGDKILNAIDPITVAKLLMDGWSQYQDWDVWLETTAATLIDDDMKAGLAPSISSLPEVEGYDDGWLEWMTIANTLTKLPEGEPFVFTVLDGKRFEVEYERLAHREARLAAGSEE